LKSGVAATRSRGLSWTRSKGAEGDYAQR
jgi:hypothetical protein